MNILVLGIGNAQVDLLKLLSKRHTVHALSYTSEGSGKKYATYFQKVDIKNKEAVLDYALKYDINLVCSVGSDLGAVTSAWVSRQLQLPSLVSPEIAYICNTKNLLRKHLEGLPYNIEFKVIEKPSDFGDFKLPCIMKPVDSQGQRGVFLIENEQQFFEKFETSRSFSSTKRLILEEYVQGPEVSVNAYVVNNEVHFSLISDRIVWPDFPGGLIHKHRLPSQFINAESESQIHRLVAGVVKNLGIQNGPVYFQIKLKNNEPKLIEVTPRLDGCHLWRLIKYAMGIDLLKTTMNHLIDNSIDDLTSKKLNETWILEFMCESPGTILRKNKYNIDHSLYHEWYYEEGDKIRPLNTYWEKCGYQIYQAKEVQETCTGTKVNSVALSKN